MRRTVCNDNVDSTKMISMKSSYFMFLVILLSTSVVESWEYSKTAEEVFLSQLVDPVTGEIDEDMAELLWIRCRLSFLHLKEANEDLNLFILEETSFLCSESELECRSQAKEHIWKMLKFHPQLKQSLIDCMRRNNIMFPVSGEGGSNNQHTRYLDSLIPKPVVSKRNLLQGVAMAPSPAIDSPFFNRASSPNLVPSPNPAPSPNLSTLPNPAPSPGKSFFPTPGVNLPAPPLTENTSAGPIPGPDVKPHNRKSKHKEIVTAVVVTAVITSAIVALFFFCFIKISRGDRGMRQSDEGPLLSLTLSDSSTGSAYRPFGLVTSIKEEKVGYQSYSDNSSHDKEDSPLDGIKSDNSTMGMVPSPPGRVDGIPPLKPPPGRAAPLPPEPPASLRPPSKAGPPPPAPPWAPSPPAKVSGSIHPFAPPPSPPVAPVAKPGPPPPPPPVVTVERVGPASLPPPVVPVARPGPAPPPPPAVPVARPGPAPPPPVVPVARPGPAPPPPPEAPGTKPGPPPPQGGPAPPWPPPSLPTGSKVPHPPTGSKLSSNTASGNYNAPKTKLKPFFWDKVLANPDHSMVWHQIKSGSFQFNEEMIETLFGYAPADRNKTERKKESSSQDPSPQYIQILDTKKAQNLSILMRALNVTVEEVCDALYEGNELPAEFIETMLKMAPTEEEELKLRLFRGELSELGPAERFLKVLIDIPFAYKRLEALLFMCTLQEDVTTIKESFKTLEVACNELKSSRLFLKLLEAVLKTGNRMNDGTFRGGAQAFKLDTLLKLSDVKGTDGKTTLLHFVVQEIIRSEGVRAAGAVKDERTLSNVTIKTDGLHKDITPNTEEEYRDLGLQVVSHLSSELENVKKAAVVDADNLTVVVSKLGHVLLKTQTFLEKDMKSINEGSEFHESLKTFVQKAEVDVMSLLNEERRIMDLVKSTGDYFHGKAGKDEGLRLFDIVRDFLIILDKVCKEVGDEHKRLRKSSRKETSTAAFHPSPQQPHSDLHSRLFPAIGKRHMGYSSSDDES